MHKEIKRVEYLYFKRILESSLLNENLPIFFNGRLNNKRPIIMDPNNETTKYFINNWILPPESKTSWSENSYN